MDLDEHEVVWDRYREGPLAGLTLAKARIANDALCGYPVRVWNRDEMDWRDRKVGIFLGITLPGSWVRMAEQSWDIRIATGSLDEEYVGHGTTRVMGLGAIADLVVIGDEWGWCDDCCGWRPRHLLGSRGAITGAWKWADPDEVNDPYYADTVCRRPCQ